MADFCKQCGEEMMEWKPIEEWSEYSHPGAVLTRRPVLGQHVVRALTLNDGRIVLQAWDQDAARITKFMIIPNPWESKDAPPKE